MIHHTHLRAHTHTHTHTRIRTRTRCRQGRHHMGPGLSRRDCAFIGASVHTKHTHHTHAHTRTHTLQARKAPHGPWTTTHRMCLFWCKRAHKTHTTHMHTHTHIHTCTHTHTAGRKGTTWALDYHAEDVPLSVLAGHAGVRKVPAFAMMRPHSALAPARESVHVFELQRVL